LLVVVVAVVALLDIVPAVVPRVVLEHRQELRVVVVRQNPHLR
jgi:hypothetical protein